VSFCSSLVLCHRARVTRVPTFCFLFPFGFMD
jgi:hypothetical protein